MSQRYVIITPCRNEAAFARQTLDSVLAQTVLPARWIIVDDGSTDDTPSIIAEYAEREDWIEVVRREDRGRRSVGPGVIDAFYDGLATVDLDDYDYVCKLDLDLILPPRYFQILMTRMEAEPRLGCSSGKPYFVHPRTGELVSEKISDEMSVGASKFYRVSCFRQIGGFVREVMWDGIDCHRCRMLGWIVESSDDPDLRFTHLRPMGSSDRSIWRGRLRWGFGQYFMGTSFIYVIAMTIYRMPRHPVILGGLLVLLGYLLCIPRGVPRYDDLEFRRFLRRFQWRCLVSGKKAATAAVNEEQAPLWDPGRCETSAAPPTA